jgi:hypothetical protein
VPKKRGYRRADLIERHLWRTRLEVDPPVAVDAAVVLVGHSVAPAGVHGPDADWLDLLHMCGLIHPDGPGHVGISFKTRHPRSNEADHPDDQPDPDDDLAAPDDSNLARFLAAAEAARKAAGGTPPPAVVRGRRDVLLAALGGAR